MAIVFDRINGLADSKWSGVKGSVAECVGLDIHTTPGLTKVQQKLTKESGSTVDEFVKIAIAVSNGYSFWFSADSGKIWARTSGGSWSLAHTTTAAVGEHKCLGALEYNGFIYWATEKRLHRIAIANADDVWASEVEDWATFDIGDLEWHPMKIQDLSLFIGDGNQVAEVNSSSTFNSDVLDLNTPLRIKTMAPFEWDILIGTFVANTVNRTELIRWDTVSPSWNISDPIEEVGINAFIRDDNYLYVNAGRAGNLYFYNGEKLLPFKRIPGTYSNTQYGTVHPGSTGNYKGIPIFGFSNGAGNPAKQGVYSFGSYSRDYNKIMDLSWVNSQDKVSGQEIGAILVLDFDILVAWKDTANYGVDKIDYSNKYASAYLETRMLFESKRNLSKAIQAVRAFYASLPASTNIVMSYKVNHGSYIALTGVKDTDFNALKADLSITGVGTLQIKAAFTVNNNDAPTMEGLEVMTNE